MPPTIELLLADDHPAVLQQLQILIDGQPDMHVVASAADGRDAVERALSLQPDVVVTDFSMPRMNGLEATAALAASCPQMRVVLLTAHQDRSYAQALLAAGGRGYVLKHSPPAVLLAAIRAVATGHTFLDPALAGMPALTTAPGPPASHPSPEVLTDCERSVLQRTAQGLSTREVAAELGVDVDAIVAARAEGMAKLCLEGRVALVRYAEAHGWREAP